MARIRTIKPEFPQSESMGRVSRDARLLFIMLWTICDDAGRARANSRMLASLLFPYDDDATQQIPEWLMELEREKSIRVYAVDGNSYLQILKWQEHQKIDKPSASKFPSPREDSRDTREPSIIPRLGPRTKEGTREWTKDLPEANASGRAAAAPDGGESLPAWWPKRDRYGRVVSELTDKIVFDVGKAVLGSSAGGQVARLRKCYGGDMRAVTDLLLQANEKSDPCEWFAAVLKRAEMDERHTPNHEKYPENVYREH